MGINRRTLLGRSGQLGLGVSLFGSVQALLSAPAAAAAAAQDFTGYGPLVDDPDGMLALPEGFSYRVVTEAGQTRTYEGEPSPGVHDGAAAFAADDGNVLIVLNHEVRGGPDDDGAVPHENGLVYRADAGDGCTVIKTTGDGELLWETVGIAGTCTNCAGGVTPWNTWLTCEETADDDHGWVFEIDPHDLDANQDPHPITTLGRFRHEALCIDPEELVIYLTEDAEGPNGTVYRWLPPSGFRGRTGALRQLGTDDGELAAMSCTDADGALVDDLAQADGVDTVYTVEWVPVEDRAAENGALRSAAGITRAAKLEGAWWSDDGAYVVSSYADSHRGPAKRPRTTTTAGCSRSTRTTWTPTRTRTRSPRWARRARARRHRHHPQRPPRRRWLSPRTRARSSSTPRPTPARTSPASCASSTPPWPAASAPRSAPFSPDGRVLFAGIQKPGVLFAITGPWQQSNAAAGTGSRRPGSSTGAASPEGSGSSTDSTGRRGSSSTSRGRDETRWRESGSTRSAATSARTSRSSR